MESRSLLIRESTFADCDYFAKWETDPGLTEFFTINDDWDYEKIVTDYFKKKEDETCLQYTICLKPDNQPIGRVIISQINKRYDSLDITRFYISEAHRGNGYGEDALRLVLEYCFINLHMERVTLDYLEKNKVAANMYDKIGFVKEGLMRNAGKKNGKYLNLQQASMLRAEYYDKIHK